MPAISKAWVAIADAAVDPDSPIDAALMTGLRDDVVHLREWLGAAFTAGAVQDHDHDGVNSKAVAGEIGFVRAWPGLVLPGATWGWCDGGTISRATYATLQNVLMKSANVTITIASPGVVTWTAHGLRTNMPIRFFTTGALPTGITAGTNGGPGVGAEYFVKLVNANTFNIAATPGGANINTSGSQSGVHTAVIAPHGNGNGSTTFHKPDYRGRVPVGRDDMGGTAANRMTVGGAGFDANVPGRSGGAQTHTLSTGESAVHTHTQNAHFHAERGDNAGGGSSLEMGMTTSGTAAGAYTQANNSTTDYATATNQNTGGGGAHLNTQPSSICDWIIKIA